MLTISKPDFVLLIHLIQEQERKELKLYRGVSQAFDCDIIGSFCQQIISGIAGVLDRLCTSEGEWVTWWLWGNQEPLTKICKVNGKEYLLDTPEKLYDFLLEQ